MRAESLARALAVPAVLLGLLVLAAVTVIGDLLFAVTLFDSFVAAIVGLAAALTAAGWYLSRSRIVVASAAAFLLGMVALRLAVFNPVKPFRAFFLELRPGVSETVVLELLTRHFPAEGPHRRPVASRSEGNSLWFTLDPTDGEYNSELIEARFESGRLVEAGYYPD